MIVLRGMSSLSQLKKPTNIERRQKILEKLTVKELDATDDRSPESTKYSRGADNSKIPFRFKMAKI